MIIKGYPSQEKRDDSNQSVVTVQPVRNGGHAIDVTTSTTAAVVASDTVEASSTERIINATAHSAEAGDIIRFSSGGTLYPREIPVESVTTNTITLAKPAPSAPTTGDPFDVMRFFHETISLAGSTFTQIAFIRDAANQIVTEDTGTPANNRPLPGKLFNDSGTAADFGTGALSAGTIRNVPATDGEHLLNTRHEAVGTPLSARIGDATDFISSEAIANSQKTVSTLTKTIASLSIGLGFDGTDHREVLLDSGGRTLLSTRHETVTTPLASRLSDGTDYISSESIAAAQKAVSTLTKTISTLGIMLGWDGDEHREIAVNASGELTLDTRHEAVGTPLSGRLSDGTDFIGTEAIAAAQKTVATEAAVLSTLSIGMGWDGATHREIAVDTSGNIQTTAQSAAASFPARGKVAGTALTGTYANVFTAASDLSALFVFNNCDETIVISLDAGVTDHYELTSGQSMTIDCRSNNRHIASGTDIRVKHGGVVPTTGTVRISAMV